MAPKVKTAKSSKLRKLPEICFETVGKGGWPPIFIWINNTSLGINGLHFIKVPHQMRKFLLNLALGEPLALVQEMPYFDDSIKLHPLLLSSLDLMGSCKAFFLQVKPNFFSHLKLMWHPMLIMTLFVLVIGFL
jgi:hypothetical protein